MLAKNSYFDTRIMYVKNLGNFFVGRGQNSLMGSIWEGKQKPRGGGCFLLESQKRIVGLWRYIGWWDGLGEIASTKSGMQ